MIDELPIKRTINTLYCDIALQVFVLARYEKGYGIERTNTLSQLPGLSSD